LSRGQETLCSWILKSPRKHRPEDLRLNSSTIFAVDCWYFVWFISCMAAPRSYWRSSSHTTCLNGVETEATLKNTEPSLRCSRISLTFPLMHIILQTLRIRLKLAVTLWFFKQNVAFLVFTTCTVCLTHLGSYDSFTSTMLQLWKLPVMQYCYESHASSGKWQYAFCATVAQFPIETRSVPHRFSTTSRQMSWDLVTPGHAYMWRIIASWYQIFTWTLDGEPFGRILSRVRTRNIVAVAQNS
jgi:hypothetical protein